MSKLIVDNDFESQSQHNWISERERERIFSLVKGGSLLLLLSSKED